MSEYDNIHYRMRAKYGKPTVCDFCGVDDKAMYHWARKHDAPTDASRDNWYRLCVPCHHDYDDVYRGVIQANKSREWTDDMRQNMAGVKSGSGNGFYGKHHTEETKEALRESQRLNRSTCDACGLETNAGNLARHKTRTGH